MVGLTVRCLLYRMLMVLLLSGAASAATFTVTTGTDSHDPAPGDGVCGDGTTCGLRAAIEESNLLAGPDTILFAASLAPISLTLGTISLTDSGTYVRGRAGETVIDGVNNAYGQSLLRLSGGCCLSGLILQRSRAHGIVVVGHRNTIGDTLGNTIVIVGCGLDDDQASAILISGPSASDNTVVGSHIGVSRRGTQIWANPNGITIEQQASHNVIGGVSATGRNLISGNTRNGIEVTTGAHHNTVEACLIGTDIAGALAFPNGGNGILVSSGAMTNRIGGDSWTTFNLISGNTGAGISIEGVGTESNQVRGNVIGLDATGILVLGNAGPGVAVRDGASNCTIGGSDSLPSNIIAGNLGDGIRIAGAGCHGNRLIGNFIGTDTSGYGGDGNGLREGHGVFIGEGASDNQIGGTATTEQNVISSNPGSGIFLSGSSRNVIVGNLVGVGIYSMNSAPNGTGITITDGASWNTVGGIDAGEGNTISGNRAWIFPQGAGVAIIGPGSDHNAVLGNKIGTDQTGSRALRNGSCGVIIGEGAQHNVVGGRTAAARNIIAGNGSGSVTVGLGGGVHLFGTGTRFNIVSGNYIGIGANGTAKIPNIGNGIGIYGGAQDNCVGDVDTLGGNRIVANMGFGIYISDRTTERNTFRSNSVFHNDSQCVAVRLGAQSAAPPPVLLGSDLTAASGTSPAVAGTIDIYAAAPGSLRHGEGYRVVGSGNVGSDSTFVVTITGVTTGDTLTAMITAPDGSSSALSNRVVVGDPTGVSDPDISIPSKVWLGQNYPNPCNPTTTIEYSLPRSSSVELIVLDVLGREVCVLDKGPRTAGSHRVIWSGRNNHGKQIASGVYLYRLSIDNSMLTKKMIFLK